MLAAMSDLKDRLPPVVRAAMDAAGIPYEVMDCDPDLADTAAFCARYGHALEDSANAILVKSKTGEEKFAACVVLATHRLDVNTTIRKKLEARKVSFADPGETKRITGMELGGVTPPGLPPALPLWIDGEVMRRPFVILGAGIRAAKIRVAPEFFLHTPNTEIVEGLAKPVA